MKASGPEVVVLGAGLAGMTAAYQLRDRDIVVVEELDRVGGRTLSGRHGEYWYNLGAQFVWDRRTLALCRELGVEVLDAEGAHTAAVMNGRLASASNPYTLFAKLPISVADRIDLGRTILRLNRLAGRMPNLDSRDLDSRSLAELMGRTRPLTKEVIDLVTESGCGLSSDEVSGWIGLGYSTHLFGGDVNGTLKQVAGGTQEISKAIAGVLDPERLVLSARIGSVSVGRDGVEVTYTQDGREESLRARVCVVALPAPAVRQLLPSLPDEKSSALRRIGDYAPVVATAWLTDETRAMPWDDLVAVPIVGDHSFEQLSNNAFFIRRRHESRHAGGTLVTLSTCARAERLLELDDHSVRARVGADLERFFPAAVDVLRAADVKVKRWRALVPFRKGWLRDQAAVRAPVGPLVFCGDYTAQPGTPGAVGSGYHAGRAALELLDA